MFTFFADPEHNDRRIANVRETASTAVAHVSQGQPSNCQLPALPSRKGISLVTVQYVLVIELRYQCHYAYASDVSKK